MKKILTLLLILTLVLSVVNVYAAEVITVTVNEEKVEFDVPPMTVNDRTMVPLRAIFEKLGATVSYVDATRTVIAQKDSTIVMLTIDSNEMYVDESKVILDVPAFETGGRTLVPVRAISEAFGCRVIWHEEEKLVEIIDSNKVVATVSNSAGKLDVYRYELDYLMNMDYTQEEALDILKETKVMQLKAIENGISLDEFDMAGIEENIEKYIQLFGSKEVFELQLAELGVTYEQYIEICKMSDVATKFSGKIAELGLLPTVAEEELKKYFDENFMKAKHILVSDKAKAYEVSENISKGGNFDDYEEICEDPGCKTFPDGYVFVNTSKLYGEEKEYFAYSGLMMVEEFEKGTAALGVGKVSQPIETTYGYHIISRVALTEKDFDDYKGIINAVLSEKSFKNVVEKWKNEAVLIKM